MIKLLTYHDIDQQQWRELIERSSTATWFQTDEAYRFYQSVGGMQAFAVGVVECAERNQRANPSKDLKVLNDLKDLNTGATRSKSVV